MTEPNEPYIIRQICARCGRQTEMVGRICREPWIGKNLCYDCLRQLAKQPVGPSEFKGNILLCQHQTQAKAEAIS